MQTFAWLTIRLCRVPMDVPKHVHALLPHRPTHAFTGVQATAPNVCGRPQEAAFKQMGYGRMSKFNTFGRLAVATALAGAAMTGAAYAETGSVQFNGFVDTAEVATCEITATQVGGLTIGDDFKTLTSKNTTAGRVKVRANTNDYAMTVSGPADWADQPAANDTNATTQTFSAFYTPDVASTGGITATEQTGSTAYDLDKDVELKADIDLVVTQDVDYEPGNYKAEVTVTCE